MLRCLRNHNLASDGYKPLDTLRFAADYKNLDEEYFLILFILYILIQINYLITFSVKMILRPSLIVTTYMPAGKRIAGMV